MQRVEDTTVSERWMEVRRLLSDFSRQIPGWCEGDEGAADGCEVGLSGAGQCVAVAQLSLVLASLRALTTVSTSENRDEEGHRRRGRGAGDEGSRGDTEGRQRTWQRREGHGRAAAAAEGDSAERRGRTTGPTAMEATTQWSGGQAAADERRPDSEGQQRDSLSLSDGGARRRRNGERGERVDVEGIERSQCWAEVVQASLGESASVRAMRSMRADPHHHRRRQGEGKVTAARRGGGDGAERRAGGAEKRRASRAEKRRRSHLSSRRRGPAVTAPSRQRSTPGETGKRDRQRRRRGCCRADGRVSQAWATTPLLPIDR